MLDKKIKQKLVTDLGEPLKPFKSIHGTMSYIEWCKKEIDKMKGNGRNVFLFRHKGQVAISRV